MENWPDVTNTGTGPGAGADGAFERFLTAALATIITIMFSWRLLVENESEGGTLHAAYAQRQAMLMEGGASDSKGAKGGKRKDQSCKMDSDKYDRCPSNRNVSTFVNAEKAIAPGQDMTYGGHDLMERKHTDFSYSAPAPSEVSYQGNSPVVCSEKIQNQDMNKETNEETGTENDSVNPDEQPMCWGSYNWEDDVYGSVHTRRSPRDFMTTNTKSRTKSESSDQSYTAGSDSSDTDPGLENRVHVTSEHFEDMYVNREYRSIIDNDEYTNMMEISSDSDGNDSSESESGDYEPPMIDDSDDEIINNSFSNVLEPIIEEDSDDVMSDSSDDDDDDEEFENDNGTNNTGKVVNETQDVDENNDDNDNEIKESHGLSSKYEETNIDDILKDELNKETRGKVDVVTRETNVDIFTNKNAIETSIDNVVNDQNVKEINIEANGDKTHNIDVIKERTGNYSGDELCKHLENVDVLCAECTHTEGEGGRITPVVCVQQNQPCETDLSPDIDDRLNTVADDTVTHHVDLFTSEQQSPAGMSEDKIKTARDLKTQGEITEICDKRITYDNTPGIVVLGSVDTNKYDEHEDAEDSLPASPIRTCALDDLNDGYISDESCSSASVVTIVSLRNCEDDYAQTGVNDVSSTDSNAGKNVGMEKSSSVIHIPQLSESPNSEKEKINESDEESDRNATKVSRDENKTPEIDYCNFVKDIEANSEERYIEANSEERYIEANSEERYIETENEDRITATAKHIAPQGNMVALDNTGSDVTTENYHAVRDFKCEVDYEVECVCSAPDVVNDVVYNKEDKTDDDKHNEVSNDNHFYEYNNGFDRGSPRHLSLDEPYFSSSQSDDSEGPREYNPYEDDFAEFHLETESDEDTFYLVMGDNSQLRKLETVTNLDSIGLAQGTKIQESEDGQSVVFSKSEEIYTDHHVKFYIKERDIPSVRSMPTFTNPIAEEPETDTNCDVGHTNGVQQDSDDKLDETQINGVPTEKYESHVTDHIISGLETRLSSESVTCDLVTSRTSETSSDTDLHACSSLSDNIPDSSSSELLHTDVSPLSSRGQHLDQEDQQISEDLPDDFTSLDNNLPSQPTALSKSEQDLNLSTEVKLKASLLLDSQDQDSESKSSESLNVPLHIEEEQDSGIQCSSSLSPDMGLRTSSSDDIDDVLQDDVILDSLSNSRHIEQAYTCNTSTSIEDNTHIRSVSLALENIGNGGLETSSYDHRPQANKYVMDDNRNTPVKVTSPLEILSLDKSPSGSLQNITRIDDAGDKGGGEKTNDKNIDIVSLDSSPSSRRRHLRYIEENKTCISPVENLSLSSQDIKNEEDVSGNRNEFNKVDIRPLNKSPSRSRETMNDTSIPSIPLDSDNKKPSSNDGELIRESEIGEIRKINNVLNGGNVNQLPEQPVTDSVETNEDLESSGYITKPKAGLSSKEDKVLQIFQETPSESCTESTIEALEDVVSPCIQHMSMSVDKEHSTVDVSNTAPSSYSENSQKNTSSVPNQSWIVRTSTVRPSSLKRSGSGVLAKITKQQQTQRSTFKYSSVLQEPVFVKQTPYIDNAPEKRQSLSRMKIQSSRQRFLSADNLSSDPVNDQFSHYKASVSSSLPRQRRYTRKEDASRLNSRRHLSYERVDHITNLYSSRDKSYQSDDSFEKPEIHKLHRNCIFSPHIHDEILNTTQSIENLGIHEQLMRYGSMTSLIETDLDTGETYETRLADFDMLDFQHIPPQRTASMSDLEYRHRMESRKPTKGRFADRNMPKSKSLMALETDIDDAMTRSGEGNLQRVPSVHELRVAKSLQKLNVPDWYKKSSVSRSGSTYSLLSERRDSTSTLSSIGYAQSIVSAPCPSLSPTNNAVVIRTRVIPTSASRFMRSAPRLPITPEKSPLPPTTSFRLPSDKFRNREKPKELMPIPVVPFSKLRLLFEEKSSTSTSKSTEVRKTPSTRSQPRSPATPDAPSKSVPSSDVPPVVTITTPESAPSLESAYEKVDSPKKREEPVYENVQSNQETVKNGKVRIQEPEVKREPPPVPEKPKHLSKSSKKEQSSTPKRSFFSQGLRMPRLTKQKSPTHKAGTSEPQSQPSAAASHPISVPSTKSSIETTV